MKATVTETQTWLKAIDIEIPVETIDQQQAEKIKKYRKEIKLPGFRVGKVPTKVIVSRFGESIRAEVIDDEINKFYRKACEDNNITPVSEAKIMDVTAKENQPITCKVEVEVDPDVEISDYKKLKIKAEIIKLKQSEVDNAVSELQNRMAEMVDVDRPSEDGDVISINYREVSVDGEIKEGFTPAPQMIEIGKGSIKDFDKGLIGLSKDEEADITIKFPKDYSDKDVAEKSGLISVTITKVSEKKLPELDNEFCKKMGDFKNLDALKERIRNDLEKREIDRAKTEAYNKVIDILIEKNKFDVPPSRIEYYIDKVIEDEAKYYSEGVTPDREEVAKRYHDHAIRSLKRYRIIEFIVKKEKVKATQELVDEKIMAIAAQYQKPFEEVKQAFRKNGTTVRIREEVKEQMALDMLINELDWPTAE